jgi:hypothetical protein
VHNLSDLDLPFTEEEVWSTIKQMPSDKAPDLDSYTGHFYKTCWPIIKDDIMVPFLQSGVERLLILGSSTRLTSSLFSQEGEC